MDRNLDKRVDRINTNSIKWEYINEGKSNELLPLWIADMDFSCAEPILKAMHDRVDRKIFGYSIPFEDYYSTVSEWIRRKFDWDVKKETIQTSPGVVPALGMLVRALTEEGDGIIIQRPVYYPFTSMIANNNREVINNALINKEGQYVIDFVDLAEKVKKAKMMILCSPHNPVGRVWSKEELIKIATICMENDVILVSDEIHWDLVRKGVKHTPVAKLVDDDRIITCTAASKTFNLAGMQISSVIIKNEEMRNKWNAEILGKAGLYGLNPISISATTAAYTECDEWLEGVLEYIDKNFEFVDQFIKENFPKATFSIPEGTYFAWIDFREYGYTHKELEELMVKHAKVALDEGYIFGVEGEGFERINVACQRSILEDCLNRMKIIIKSF